MTLRFIRQPSNKCWTKLLNNVALEPVGRTQQLVNHELLRECWVDAVEVDRVEPVRRSHRLAADTFDAVVDE